MEEFSFSSLSHYLQGSGYIPGGESRISSFNSMWVLGSVASFFGWTTQCVFTVNAYMRLDLLGSDGDWYIYLQTKLHRQQKHGMYVGTWHKPATATKHGYEACSEFN